MAKYHRIAMQIEAVAKAQGLKPGDALPSERELAQRLGVSYGTIRLANDCLFRKGLIERRQGQGTFLTTPNDQGSEHGRAHRLGLLAVDMQGFESPMLRETTFSLQRHTQRLGYELIVEQVEIEDLVRGHVPRMISRRSVEGYFLYGRVRKHHTLFFDEFAIPYMLLGNRPVPAHVPHVGICADHLAYEMTRELIKADRWPVWLDADPANLQYEVGQEMIRGYSRALEEFSPSDGSLYLCPVRLNSVSAAVKRLRQSHSDRAAYIVQDWSSSLLISEYMAREQDRGKMLFAPVPMPQGLEIAESVSVVKWDRLLASDDLVVPGIEEMNRLLERQQDRLHSWRLDFECRFVQTAPTPIMSLNVRRLPYDRDEKTVGRDAVVAQQERAESI